MAQASFFYYNPESSSDNSSRQHDLFTPQPSAILKSSPMPAHEAAGMQPLYTPSAARPLAQKVSLFGHHEPAVLSVETEFGGLYDDLSYPRTPGLSTTSSAVSSPPYSSYLPTPTNSFFENLTGVKEGCEQDVKSEILAGGWDFQSRPGSPVLTPVFVNPPNVTASQAASEVLSTSSCPSLSPSPSPAPQHQHQHLQHGFISQQAEHFCDPRNLIVGSKTTTPLINQLEIPTLPAFIPSNDDLLLGTPTKSADAVALEPLPPVVDSVPFFDSFSDLDSDTDFITDLSQETSPTASVYSGVKRGRVDSIPFSENSSFDDSDWMSSFSSDDGMGSSRFSKKQKVDADHGVNADFASHLAAGSADAVTTSVSDQDSKDVAGMAPGTSGGDSASTPSGGAQSSANRRGRKQSLTDDPSKTFVCTLCARRFRRQEHLKRHYRSLHTQDKPFECTDCGKKFSRSDNLAQHARTHGNTTALVGLGMAPSAGSSSSAIEMDESTAALGAALFEAANAVSSSSSSASSSEDEKAAKKRKRDE